MLVDLGITGAYIPLLQVGKIITHSQLTLNPNKNSQITLKHLNFYIIFHQNALQNVSYLKCKLRDFPGGAVVKNPPANSGDTGSSPGPGRSRMPWSN